MTKAKALSAKLTPSPREYGAEEYAPNEEATLGFFEWVASDDAPKDEVQRLTNELAQPPHLLSKLLTDIIANNPILDRLPGKGETDEGRLSTALAALLGRRKSDGRPRLKTSRELGALTRIFLEFHWHRVNDEKGRMPSLRTMCEYALKETHPEDYPWAADDIHSKAGDLEEQFERKKLLLILDSSYHPREKELVKARAALRELGVLP